MDACHLLSADHLVGNCNHPPALAPRTSSLLCFIFVQSTDRLLARCMLTHDACVHLHHETVCSTRAGILSVLLIVVATATMTVQDVNPPLLLNEQMTAAYHRVDIQKWWFYRIVKGLLFKLYSQHWGQRHHCFDILKNNEPNTEKGGKREEGGRGAGGGSPHRNSNRER